MIAESMFRQETSLSKQDSDPTMENPDYKFGFSGNNLGLFRESGEGSQSKPSKIGFSLGSQELTLSYLCENRKSVENESSGRNLCNLKGKGVDLENLGQEGKWIERDFLQLNDTEDGRSKREAEEDNIRGRGDCKKKVKLETQTLKLSLALPDVSLSLSESNAAIPNRDVANQLKPLQSLAIPNNCITQATCSDDFTTASLSYSYSLPFSHNPSCSLTRNSTEYCENSVGNQMRETDQMWNCGEGTNGSVHSRFKPIGDGVSLSNHGSGVVHAMLNRSGPLNRDTCNSLYRAAASDNSSFFPSELPAKPIKDLFSVDTKSKSLDHLQGFDSLQDVRGQKLSKGEKVVRDVITEPVAVMSQLSRELPVEAIESAKEYLKYIMSTPERKDELVYLQNLLERRSDLTKEILSKSDGVQMEILVAVKFGLPEFVSGKLRLPTSELVEIFLYMRCRNVNCKSPLPVDDCDCKICSTKEGFCSQCMCPVCYNYDCASNTCCWVGCDACSHWCHADCGTEKKLIRPGPSLKGSSGSTEMQFYCQCGHASEMFGFVKDVFVCCAKDWGLETLKKELDCVRRIFKGSEDLKGKELYLKAAELINRLERRVISPSDACSVIIHFFTTKIDKDMAEYAAPAPSFGPNDTACRQRCHLNDAFLPPSANLTRNSSFKGVSYDNLCYSTPKPHVSIDRHVEDELSGKFSKKDIFEFDISESSIIRWKEEEARMLQNRADEARKEVEEYRQLVQAKTEKLEQEYSEKLAKLCLQETEERRRRNLEELRILESSHSDYFKMKIRMQAEISGLVERMEATKQLWV